MQLPNTVEFTYNYIVILESGISGSDQDLLPHQLYIVMTGKYVCCNSGLSGNKS